MIGAQKKSIKLKNLTLISLLITILILTTIALTTSIKTKEINSKSIENKAFISFYRFDEDNKNLKLIRDEQSLLFDSEPIFIPTQWSESSNQIKNTTTDSLFNDFPPIIKLYNERDLSVIINENLEISSPSDILNKFINPFIGVGQNNPKILPLKKSIAHVTIENLNDSNIVEKYEIMDNTDIQIHEQLWVPIKFLLIIDEAGPIMPLFMVESSGIEQIDNFFKDTLSTSLLKLSSLPAGYYKISVAP